MNIDLVRDDSCLSPRNIALAVVIGAFMVGAYLVRRDATKNEPPSPSDNQVPKIAVRPKASSVGSQPKSAVEVRAPVTIPVPTPKLAAGNVFVSLTKGASGSVNIGEPGGKDATVDKQITSFPATIKVGNEPVLLTFSSGVVLELRSHTSLIIENYTAAAAVVAAVNLKTGGFRITVPSLPPGSGFSINSPSGFSWTISKPCIQNVVATAGGGISVN